MIKKIFPILAIAMFSSNLGIGIVVPLLPIYAQDLGASGVWIGALISSFGTASTASTLVFGRLSDRKGRKLFLVTGLLIYSMMSVAYIFAGNISVLILVRFLHGLSGGMVMPIAFAYIGDVAPKGEEGKWMGYSSAAFYGGFGAGPLIGGVLSQYFGIATAFAFMAGLNFLAFLVAFIFLPGEKSRVARSITTPRPSFRLILRSDMVRGLFSYQVAQALGQGSFITFVPIFAVAAGSSLTLIGIMLAITMSLMSLLGPVGGLLADRANRRAVVVSGSAFVILALAMMPNTAAFWQLLLLAVLMAFGAGLAMPSIGALGVQEGRKYGMGSTLGVTNMGQNIGFAVGPILAGQMADLGGTAFAFYFGSSMVLLGMVPFLLFTRPSASPAAGNSA